MVHSTQMDKKSFQKLDKLAHSIVKHTNLKVVLNHNMYYYDILNNRDKYL